MHRLRSKLFRLPLVAGVIIASAIAGDSIPIGEVQPVEDLVIEDGDALISIKTVNLTFYLVERSADMDEWERVGAAVRGDGAVHTVRDEGVIEQANGNMFYRLIVIKTQ